MSQRTSWRFAYSGEQVAAGAQRKAEHHRAREEWWRGEKAEAETKMRAATVELAELPVTGGTRVEIKIDPALTARYNECTGKMQQHKQAAEEFERWASVLQANPLDRLQLDADDIHFFALSAHADMPT